MRAARVAVFSKFPKEKLYTLLKKHGMQPQTGKRAKPDIVLCYGGDGTFLLAEAKHPGVPKLLVRKSLTCKKCQDIPIEDAVPLLARAWHKGLRTTTEMKLEATIIRGRKKTSLLATNDIIIRNEVQAHALRFTLLVNKRVIAKDMIGDGIVVCTPFGSTAYYHSITREIVTKGIGIALNNPVQDYPPLVVDESVVVELVVNRGSGFVSADIEETMTRIKQGDRVIIKKAKGVAHIIYL